MRASPCLLGVLALFACSAKVHAIDCLPSAAAVRQEYPNARPSWTLQAQGHEGSKCWYAATRPPSDDNQEGTAIMKPVAEPPQPAQSADKSDFHARLLSEVVPRELLPDGPASFGERFSAAYGNTGTTDYSNGVLGTINSAR